ncbi:alpha-amylase [Listeria cossartiae subsp. cayugensis]|uniref:alpha-amylase n=1 Tax=Listeria cossartiae TaxID=2838249 RepID=UPI0028803D45|nr:alpha-amylase [Listeria cossartiae]MDT0000692.1 alpha-amylase [Listeria cossartiae subsp. cayugensis]MDT0009204.1 alpha-amylase [Listeria cossartiae subsp. cayugensis]MDT0031035.1 alpha-amylase [Listeria cossartiae subsp. cayugensis]MDT0039151.1 alpha-amylase [Listeria cossartiae subsp. cayugensis]MDT0044189.1 alpha-amylase [Listeria cossartiae subsp. cayugensis]
MKLDLWKWEMLLQGREFRNKTNDNWQKLIDWSSFISTGLNEIYVYVNKADSILNKKIDTVDKAVNARVNELISGSEQLSEVVDSRVDAEGTRYPVLRERLNQEQLIFSNKSTVQFDVENIINMQKQDIGLLTSKIISEAQTVCFSNVSSFNEGADIVLEKTGETSFSEKLTSLVFVKIGANERYQMESIGA